MNWLMIIEREMNVNTLKSVYFIGAGGIGMSALVRYFLSKGKNVGGYDRTPSELTEKLIEEGAAIHYEDSSDQIGHVNSCRKRSLCSRHTRQDNHFDHDSPLASSIPCRL